jgi:hypothetical protein
MKNSVIFRFKIMRVIARYCLMQLGVENRRDSTKVLESPLIFGVLKALQFDNSGEPKVCFVRELLPQTHRQGP